VDLWTFAVSQSGLDELVNQPRPLRPDARLRKRNHLARPVVRRPHPLQAIEQRLTAQLFLQVLLLAIGAPDVAIGRGPDSVSVLVAAVRALVNL